MNQQRVLVDGKWYCSEHCAKKDNPDVEEAYEDAIVEAHLDKMEAQNKTEINEEVVEHVASKDETQNQFEEPNDDKMEFTNHNPEPPETSLETTQRPELVLKTHEDDNDSEEEEKKEEGEKKEDKEACIYALVL